MIELQDAGARRRERRLLSVGAVIVSGADGDSVVQTYTLYACDWGGVSGNGRAGGRAWDEMEVPALRSKTPSQAASRLGPSRIA